MLAESRIQNENSNGLLAVETENIVPIELENPIEIKEDPIAVCLEMEELSDQMPQLILGELANVVNKCKFHFFYHFLEDLGFQSVISYLFAVYKCGYCGEAFESAKLLGCHFQDTHAKSNYEPKITKIEQFECYICKAKWKTFEELRDHMIHHERNHKCEICNESLSVIELKSHLCGNERTIDCEYCDKKCTAIVDLMKHLKGMHENQRLYRCNQCPKFFPMTILKEYHIMNHVEVAKPFACETCLKCFAQKLSLTNHMKRHNAEKSVYNAFLLFQHFFTKHFSNLNSLLSFVKRTSLRRVRKKFSICHVSQATQIVRNPYRSTIAMPRLPKEILSSKRTKAT